MSSTGNYLRSACKAPLLTAAEEIELSRLVQQRQRLIEAFPGIEADSSVQAAAMASERLSRMALRRILTRGKQAKDKFIISNMRLCVAIAKKHTTLAGPSLELSDLTQAGALGLVRAVELFDPERGYKFSTFAYFHILQRVRRAISQECSLIRVPIHVRDDLARIKKLQSEAAVNGGSLSIADAAHQIKSNPELIDAALRTRTLSLNALVRSGSDTELEELLAVEPETHSTSSLLTDEQITFIRDCIDTLPGRRPQVIRALFGISEDNPNLGQSTCKEIAEQVGISFAQIRRLRIEGMGHLRTRLAELEHAL